MTITTCGHAIAPQTSFGKGLAGVCTICGVFILKMPIPIIVNSFSTLYDNRMWKTKVEVKKKMYISNQGYQAAIARRNSRRNSKKEE